MAIVIAFLTPVAIAFVICAVKSFAKFCKEEGSRGKQATFNK